MSLVKNCCREEATDHPSQVLVSTLKMAPRIWDLSPGTTWPSMELARKAVRDTCIGNGESFRVHKATASLWVAVCRESSCSFRIRINCRRGSAQISISRPHVCPPDVHAGWRESSSVEMLQQHYREAVADDRSITAQQIQTNELLANGNQISYKQAWRARTAILDNLKGPEEKSTVRRRRGRPRTVRAGGDRAVTRVFHCALCGQPGHTRRTCQTT